MADDRHEHAYDLHDAEPSVGARLLRRATRSPRRLLRTLALGDAIAERPDTGVPRPLRKRKRR